MDIFLSINNREQIIKLPVVPVEFKIQSGMANETFKTINQGEIKLMGLPSLQTITIESFFPGQDYTFLRDRSYSGWEYVEIIEAWKLRRIPIRLIITETPINMACAIESFEYGPKDGSGDIHYSLSLSEFRFIELEQRSV